MRRRPWSPALRLTTALLMISASCRRTVDDTAGPETPSLCDIPPGISVTEATWYPLDALVDFIAIPVAPHAVSSPPQRVPASTAPATVERAGGGRFFSDTAAVDGSLSSFLIIDQGPWQAVEFVAAEGGEGPGGWSALPRRSPGPARGRR